MKRLSATRAAILRIVLLIILFIGVNVIVGGLFPSTRLDLTAHGLYTISPGTRAMLGKLSEPITLRYYFSERLAANYQTVSAYGVRVRDLLRELVSKSHGKLKLDIIDPEPFSGDEETAEAYGLKGAPTETGEKVYLGLVGTNLVDGIEAIPFLSPDREQHLEYDVAALIHALATPEKPKLGVLSSLPLETGPGGMMAAMQGKPTQPYVVYEQLRKSFDLENLKEDMSSVPADVGAVLVVHPTGLKPSALYALDQFALRGGRLLVFVDPLSESSAASASQFGGGAQTSSDLSPLLKAWGIAYNPGEVVLDRARAISVQYGAGDQAQALPYVAWLRLKGDDLNRSDLVTSDIDTLQIPSAGHIEQIKGAPTKFISLVQTSADSQIVPAAMLQMGGDPPALLEQFKASGKRLTLAARVSGQVQTAFPNGAPDAASSSKSTPAQKHLSQSQAPLNVIVVADTDLLEDRFWVDSQNFLGQRVVQPTAGNGYLLINAADNLLGSPDLISLRSRARSDRPFTVVQAIQRRAQEQYQAEESRLKQNIQETEGRLQALQSSGSLSKGAANAQGADIALTPEAAKEVRKFQSDLAQSRRALREVQRKLRVDVNALGDLVKLLNIALMPLIVAAVAVFMAVARRQRRYQARTKAVGA